MTEALEFQREQHSSQPGAPVGRYMVGGPDVAAYTVVLSLRRTGKRSEKREAGGGEILGSNPAKSNDFASTFSSGRVCPDPSVAFFVGLRLMIHDFSERLLLWRCEVGKQRLEEYHWWLEMLRTVCTRLLLDQDPLRWKFSRSNCL